MRVVAKGSLAAAFQPATGPGDAGGQPRQRDRVFIFCGDRLLVEERGHGASVPVWHGVSAERTALVRHFRLGELDGRPAWTAEVANRETGKPELRFRRLRSLFDRLTEPELAAASRAVQLVAWDRDHRHCGRCGSETERAIGEYRRTCPHCALACYPRLSPAVIVLVYRGDEVLLARHPRLPEGMFSTLAGFVEPGETLEQTVAREIQEEVGLEVAEPRYFGSQPWPFPNSLMVGFFARYAGGEIVLGPDANGKIELDEARWFPISDLPTIPPRISIARALIEAFRLRRHENLGQNHHSMFLA